MPLVTKASFWKTQGPSFLPFTLQSVFRVGRGKMKWPSLQKCQLPGGQQLSLGFFLQYGRRRQYNLGVFPSHSELSGHPTKVNVNSAFSPRQQGIHPAGSQFPEGSENPRSPKSRVPKGISSLNSGPCSLTQRRSTETRISHSGCGG